MASSSASSPAPASTPVHSHPLLADEQPSRSRRSRGGTKHDRGATISSPGSSSSAPAQTPRPTPRSSPNYFALKAQLQQGPIAGAGAANWDGSVRGYGRHAPPLSLPATWDGAHRPPPPFVVGSSKDVLAPQPSIVTDDVGLSPEATARILATRWHECSDEAIQETIASLSASDSPAVAAGHPYHAALRVLSSATHNLTRIRMELEEARRALVEREVARRQRAEELMKELMPSELEVARRVIQSLFTDDDEGGHRIQRKQSHISLTETLSEAIEDDGLLARTEELRESSTPMASKITITPPADEDSAASVSEADDAQSVAPSSSSPEGPQFGYTGECEIRAVICQ
ncbi:hypothetical protein EVG20_g10002 [Dentipellis fragilis]|uniref:Uncharacterized protein n=1 Tax=Dentipellis fragilis TaxID=205917 RepID=A0A4Y9XVC2_9AGAM|nr:hypothetical protein EVG20_g10002 [Dentipellis fragilis]